MNIQNEWRFSPETPFYAGTWNLGKRPLEPHRHPGLEIAGVISGHGRLNYGGKSYELAPGDLSFLDPLVTHAAVSSERGNLLQVWIHMPFVSLLSIAPIRGDMRLYQPFIATRASLSPVMHHQQALVKMLRRVEEINAARREDWDLECWIMLMQVLFQIRRHALASGCSAKAASHYEFDIVTKSTEFIQTHFKEPVTVAQLAKQSNLSPSRFTHIFSNIVGMSPIQYRNHVRIQQAVDMVIATPMKLKTIAQECGYEGLSHFYDVFVKYTGSPPGAFRTGIAK